MIITYQTISNSGSFSMPKNTDIEYGMKKSAEDILYTWECIHNKLGSNPIDATLLAYIGRVPDTQDIYPDYEIVRGKRGAIIWNRV